MEIRTPRLLLRDFVESDVPSVWGYQSDPRYLQHTPWKTRTENAAREFVLMLIGWANDEEAGAAMLEFAFRVLRIHRVFSETDVEHLTEARDSLRRFAAIDRGGHPFHRRKGPVRTVHVVEDGRSEGSARGNQLVTERSVRVVRGIRGARPPDQFVEQAAV
jgi:hypothetical protein